METSLTSTLSCPYCGHGQCCVLSETDTWTVRRVVWMKCVSCGRSFRTEFTWEEVVAAGERPIGHPANQSKLSLLARINMSST